MGLSKTQIFNDQQNQLASLFKALGHPARIAILEYLGNQQGCICNDIVEEIGLAQPTISQHLKELKAVGFIQGEISGKRVCYCIELRRWEEAQNLINTFFNRAQQNCCD